MWRLVTHPVLAAIRLWLCITLIALPSVNTWAQGRRGVITGDGVSTREGPGVTFDRVGRLKSGDQVEILDEYEGWLQVKDSDGQDVWVFARWVREMPADSVRTAPDRLDQPPPEPMPTPASTASVDSFAPPPLREHTGKKLPLVWIGAGAAAVAVLGVVALNGGDESQTGSVSFQVHFP